MSENNWNRHNQQDYNADIWGDPEEDMTLDTGPAHDESDADIALLLKQRQAAHSGQDPYEAARLARRNESARRPVSLRRRIGTIALSVVTGLMVAEGLHVGAGLLTHDETLATTSSHLQPNTLKQPATATPTPNASIPLQGSQPTASTAPKVSKPDHEPTYNVPPTKPVASGSKRRIFVANILGAVHTGRKSAMRRMNGLVRSFRKEDPDIGMFTEMEPVQQRRFKRLEGKKYAMVYTSPHTHNVLVYKKNVFDQVGGRKENIKASFSIPYLCGGHPSQGFVKLRDKITHKLNILLVTHVPADTGRCPHNKGKRSRAFGIIQKAINGMHKRFPKAIIQAGGDWNTSKGRKDPETGKANRVLMHGRNHMKSPLGRFIPKGRRGLDQVFGINALYNGVKTISVGWTDHGDYHIVPYDQENN